MTIQAGEAFEDLKEAIKNKDKQLTLDILQVFKDNISDIEFSAVMVTPSKISELHTLIVEHFGIPHKLLQLNKRVPNKTYNAYLFVQAMMVGVGKSNV